MSKELKPWPRPHWQSGGGDALLFYVVFGKTFEDLPLSRSKYRTNGLPEGFDLMQYDEQKFPDVFADFRSGYLWEHLEMNNPELAEQIAQCGRCVVLRGSPTDPETLDYLRDSIGYITYFLDAGGIAVYDPQMLRWWSPADWRDEIFDPEEVLPGNHTVILTSEEEGLDDALWFHTRGMRKFGRPDISIHGVGPDHQEAIIDLCNRFIEYQAFGGIIPDGKEMKMRSLPEGGIAHHGGSEDDPDFNNVHVEIVWPDGKLS